MKPKQPQIAGVDLSTASEGGLLQFALAVYRLSHANEKAKYVFAQAIGRTEAHLDQCLVDEAHIGTVNWLKIQKLLPLKLFDIWVAFQQEQFDFKQTK